MVKNALRRISLPKRRWSATLSGSVLRSPNERATNPLCLIAWMQAGENRGRLTEHSANVNQSKKSAEYATKHGDKRCERQRVVLGALLKQG
jgi:hypothetical protein